MVASLRRSALIVNDETPTLYFLVPTPGMMLSNDADCHSVVRPSFWPTALNRSTSNPMTVLPSASRNSLGAYVESVPMTSLPADLMSAGTLSARLVSAEALAAGVEPVPVLLPDSEPQAATEVVSATATASPRIARRPGEVRNIRTPLLRGKIWLSDAEVGVLDRRVVQELGAGAFLDDPAGLQNVRPVCAGKRLLSVLFDQEDRRALLVDLDDDVEDL